MDYSLSGGSDRTFFSIDSTTGELAFLSPPDFENPTDSDRNNIYEVQVAVSDSANYVTQDFSVNVTDIAALVVFPLPAQGGKYQAFVINGQLHVKRPKDSSDAGAPLALSDVGAIQFEGTALADCLNLDQSLNTFAGFIVFNGIGGNDQLDARAVGLDVWFNGGEGNDSFLGGSGYDTVDGGAGSDSLNGGEGGDILWGAEGNDKLIGGGGDDVLDGEDGNDKLDGGVGDDSLRGGNGNDKLFGGAGNDILLGSAGKDALDGGDGLDWLIGGAGKDKLKGGLGADIINPGTADTGIDKVSDKTCTLDPSLTFDFDALLATLL